MASVVPIRQVGGHAFAIDFAVHPRDRKRWHLGRVARDFAEDCRRRLESVVKSVKVNQPIRPEDRIWLQGLSPDRLEALRKTGLLDGSQVCTGIIAVGDLITRWLDHTQRANSQRTLELYTRTGDVLLAHFGERTPVSACTRDGAEMFAAMLRDRSLAEATVRQHIRHAKACFGLGMKRDLVEFNPFDRIVSASIAAARGRCISRGEALAILAELPTDDHRAVVALNRFAGLRVPSEPLALTWGRVDFARLELNVWAQKTKSERVVPMDPIVASALRVLCPHEPDPDCPVIEVSDNNLARTLRNAARRAGVEPWDRPFQTMRQSCETDWADVLPPHVVADLMGHSEDVSRRHYLIVRDDHRKVISGGGVDPSCSKSCSTPKQICSESGGSGVGATDHGEYHNSESGGGLRNSPARIRTGDRAIMSRLL